MDIFRAVHAWVAANPSDAAHHTPEILGAVRLALLSTPDLLKVVRPTNLVPPNVMLDAIQSKTESRDMELKYRGYLSKSMAYIIHNLPVNCFGQGNHTYLVRHNSIDPVSYTHLTLPTNREV